MRALNGGPAQPTDKPPRPFEEGVGRLPTMVSNVETLALIPFVHRHRRGGFPRPRARRPRRGHFLRRSPARAGRRRSTRFRTACPSPSCSTSTVCPADQVHGVLMGGYFAGLLNRDILDVTLDHESLRRLDSGLGCGAITDPHRGLPGGGCGAVMAYFDRGERRPVRVVLQRHGGDVGGDRGAARRGRHQRGSGPVGALVGGAAAAVAPARRWTPRRTWRPACCRRSRKWSIATCKTLVILAESAHSQRCAPTKSRRWRRRENSSRSNSLRRVRHLRQARAGLLLTRRLGLCLAHRRRNSARGGPPCGHEGIDGLPRARDHLHGRAPAVRRRHIAPARSRETPEPDPKSDDSEAIWGFVR